MHISLFFSFHLNSLVLCFISQFVRPFPHMQIYCLLHFHMPVCESISFIALKSTTYYPRRCVYPFESAARSSFVSFPRTYVHPFSHNVNQLLIPHSSPRSCVHPHYRIQIHYSLRFCLPVCASSPFLAFKSSTDSILAYFQLTDRVYIPFFRTEIYCILHFHLPGRAYIIFLAFQSITYSIFISKEVRPLFSLQLKPLFIPFPTSSGCVLPVLALNSTTYAWYFHLPGCAYILFLAFKSLTPYLSTHRSYVYPFSRTSIHCLLHFRLPGRVYILFLSFKFTAYSTVNSDCEYLLLHLHPLLHFRLPVCAFSHFRHIQIRCSLHLCLSWTLRLCVHPFSRI